MGSICSPLAEISPLQTLKNLWDDEFPTFDAMEDVNHVLNPLVNGNCSPPPGRVVASFSSLEPTS